MSLIFVDSFDHYATAQILSKYTSMTSGLTIVASGRNGTSCLVNASGSDRFVNRSVGNKQTLVIGFAVYFISTLAQRSLLQVLDSGTIQLDFRINTDYTVSIYRGTTFVGTTSQAFSTNAWDYFEVKVTIDNTNGSVELRRNGTPIYSASSIDTQNTVNAYITTVSFYPNVTSGRIDDIYICDNAGSTNNDFLGDVRIEARIPDAAGDRSEFSVFPSGDNYTVVDDVTPNDDTDYVHTSGAGSIDLYNFTALTVPSGTVLGVQSAIYSRKDEAGSRIISDMIKYNGVEYSGATMGLTDTYQYYLTVHEENPYTEERWTIPEIDATQFGVKMVS